MPYDNAANILESLQTTHDVRVPSRFNGPPGSGNGGWTAALLGKHLGSEVEVTLKRPIPVDRDMHVVTRTDRATLVDRDVEIASARRAEVDLDIPEAIGFENATRASACFAGHQVHPFPGCFVCGTARDRGEGMCLFTGPYRTGMVASAWVPDADLADAMGIVTPELTCAALDCPGAWALIDRYGIEGPFVLGRITYRLERPIHAEERYLVQGWAQGREGRKSFCGTAIYDEDGKVCAAALATWFQLC